MDRGKHSERVVRSIVREVNRMDRQITDLPIPMQIADIGRRTRLVAKQHGIKDLHAIGSLEQIVTALWYKARIERAMEQKAMRARGVQA